MTLEEAVVYMVQHKLVIVVDEETRQLKLLGEQGGMSIRYKGMVPMSSSIPVLVRTLVEDFKKKVAAQ